MPIEIEVDTLAQFTEALDSGAQIVLLDNMPPDMLRQAVEMNKGRAVLEASGRVNEETVRAIAESGVGLYFCRRTDPFGAHARSRLGY